MRRRDGPPIPSLGASSPDDQLGSLRDQLYRLAVSGCFVVGVSCSPDALVAKSRTSARLALKLAQPGRARVLLIEADFDCPTIQQSMRIDMPVSMGFSEQLRRRMSSPTRPPWMLARCSPNLHVLAEGMVRAPGLLSSGQFGDALNELRPYYDVIVADGPAAGNSADTSALDAVTDGIVLVGRAGASAADLMEKSSQWFSGKRLMAVVTPEGDNGQPG